ncbi:hypothetical protein LEUCIP111803_00597 [Leucobacter soli]|uniref:DUF3043 domain-containing protein n=1 Tax=Leucobacter soli TaxID=2812850 RepID=A0A916JU07_9MICO|nr:hypothetical protein LEUCIP111803_00597 [Leucobacter soli]
MPRKWKGSLVSEDQSEKAASGADETVGKGRPTPSRKEAQAAKAQPLVGSRDKAAKKAQRQKDAELRERARVGMMQGDERYMTARDKGPQRRYVRDYVDARFSLGEFTIPLMLVVLMLSFVPGQVQVISIMAIWAFLFLAVLDAIVLGLRLRRKLAEKFGADKIQPGFRWYAAMRAFQFRMLRMPKPQVKRLQFPE